MPYASESISRFPFFGGIPNYPSVQNLHPSKFNSSLLKKKVIIPKEKCCSDSNHHFYHHFAAYPSFFRGFVWTKLHGISCLHMGVSLNGGFPPISHPKCWSFLVGKPMVVGATHHFRKPPYITFAYLEAPQKKIHWKSLGFGIGGDLRLLWPREAAQIVNPKIGRFWGGFLGGGFKHVLFPPRKLGKIPTLTHIFQRGWNHQLDLFFLGGRRRRNGWGFFQLSGAPDMISPVRSRGMVLFGMLGWYQMIKTYPPENQHVIWKGSISKGNYSYNPTFF